MIFNSAAFLVFFSLFFNLYWLVNQRFGQTIRNYFIILSSYLFYGWWNWRFLGLIILSSFVDFTIGQQIGKSNNLKLRKRLLTISVIVNLGILGFFKYFNFFLSSLEDCFSAFNLSMHHSTLEIILPVGISFYTFQTLSYTIDVYRKKIEPTKSISSFFAFVSFFPQLVAGPIERASHLLPQFSAKKHFHYGNIVKGLQLLLWGFFKKVVIADNFGLLTDQIFESTNLSGAATLCGTLFFAIQIYADFSGYSDMAIGISKMLGFELMQNFRTPYFSKTFTEFWGRWHISLSTWFRDYVYIPLGGNRISGTRTQVNIMITFLLSGLWHGANYTFLIWGGIHGLLLVMDKKVRLLFPKFLYRWFVITAVILLWLPFRAENFNQLWLLTTSLKQWNWAAFDFKKLILFSYPIKRFAVLTFIFMAFLYIESRLKQDDFSQWICKLSKGLRWTVYYALILMIILMGSFNAKPSFIYFQF